ncbi:Protein kinase [Quillaja saponaria]|uniref:Receptor-like serine/threonine-protein kinase n=1 Tax=Quillaja saponaria TaxID=32244 RepID=A0AAD7VDW8_QUISA|nr:Protein kinase [Quillaja saponaria]
MVILVHLHLLAHMKLLKQEEYILRSPFLLCIFIGLLLHSNVIAHIPLGSKLSAIDNDCWVSFNGDFAFGFFNLSDQPNQYSIGIRFNSKTIPFSDQTVVWVAGADVTVSNKSFFQLTQDGELVLFDSFKGVPAWTSETGHLSVVSAALHDNGNLVLLDGKRNIVWQSFDTPSDTLLPGQNLSVRQSLRAASKNSVSSYYSLYMNASGQLQLRWESHVVYWTSGSPASSNLSAFLAFNGALQLRDQFLKPLWSVFGEDHNDSVNYRFLRLDVDGNLRLYSWIETSQSWRSVWQAVENQCKVFATCGQQGICVFTASGSADCRCPFEIQAETNSRCLVPYQRECESGSNMFTYDHTFLYGIYPPGDSVILTSLQQCQSLCLNDPLCTVATFTNDGTAQCWMKKTEHVTGYSDPSVSAISFVKKCSGPLAVNPNLIKSSPEHSPPKQSAKFCVPCLIGASSGTLFILIILQLSICFCIYSKKINNRKKATLANTWPNSKGLVVLSFCEIKNLTGDFKHQIGPKMFKGMLPNNQRVAVKNLNASIEERKFRSVASKMGNIHHKNLLKLEGYCCELNHRFLVYEYAKNGSVKKYVDDSKLCRRLTWRKRVEICLSVAKAICYLHTGCREFVSHGNLKFENVVLDENLEAKVTEFGFASIYSEAASHGSSAEKDVEDFGKMVLMLLSGCQENGELCEWTYKELMEGRAENVADKRIDGGVDLEELKRTLRIAFWCLQSDERRRPSMGEVVKVLEGTLNVDPPPPPFACHRSPEEDDGRECVLEP